uniref:ST3 beta-galactoside alpha-2,3-sialyltransferase 4 n=1 Tax=Crocodylus porosus TaxID=8502 RepID=A0A7M4DY05_CROPO
MAQEGAGRKCRAGKLGLLGWEARCCGPGTRKMSWLQQEFDVHHGLSGCLWSSLWHLLGNGAVDRGRSAPLLRRKSPRAAQVEMMEERIWVGASSSEREADKQESTGWKFWLDVLREETAGVQRPTPQRCCNLCFRTKARTVTSGGRDESNSHWVMPHLLIKMLSKSRWKILALLVVFAVMVWYYTSWEESFYFPVQEEKSVCPQGEVEKKTALLIGNYTRDHPLFLQLKDYFWVKTVSPYELPYGTKGSEDVLLRLLAITSYSVPETILRLNNAPVYGYEQDVGSKTTMRLFYPESAHFNPKRENNPDTLLVLVPFKPMDFHWMESILNDKKRVRKGFWKQPPLIWDANPEHVRILNPYFMEITAAKLLNLPMKQLRKVKQKPTTGLLAITLALHFCDVVHIAGFGYPDSGNKKQTIHYYEQITLKSMAASEHNVSHEALAIKKMLELRVVKNLTYF